MIFIVLAGLLQQSAPSTPPAPELHLDLFGVVVDRAGDLDGDGVEDLWIGDPSQIVHNDPRAGSVRAISTNSGKLIRRITCPEGATDFGWTLARIDDADGDGVPDVAVSAQRVGTAAELAKNSDSWPPTGDATVYLYSSKTGALLRSWRGPADCQKIPWYSAGSGPSLASVGDWNGDGGGDLAIGWSFADSEDGKLSDLGRVEIVSGKDGARIHSWFGADAHDRFGFAIATLPDLDKDGKQELAASAVTDYDVPEGKPSHPNLSKIRAGYVWVLSSSGKRLREVLNPDGERRFGFSLRWLGPSDPGIHLAVGQAHYGNTPPCAWILDGKDDERPIRIGFPAVEEWYGGTPPFFPAPTGPEDSFGSQVLELRDYDGDGLRDVLVTMPQSFCEFPAAVLSRKSGAVVARVRLADPGLATHVGNSLVDLPDVNADGIEDFAIGGASVRCGECEGLVLIASGKDLSPIREFRRRGRVR